MEYLAWWSILCDGALYAMESVSCAVQSCCRWARTSEIENEVDLDFAIDLLGVMEYWV